MPEVQLPIDSVLVPLYREAHMLASLGAALSRLAFQIMVGGTILSAPWSMCSPRWSSAPANSWLVPRACSAGRLLASMGLGLLAVQRRGYRGLLWLIPLMPLYWLLISAAAIGRCGNS